MNRDEVRAKLSDTDRQFLDDLRKLFPSAKLRHLRFDDGEELGKPLPEEEQWQRDNRYVSGYEQHLRKSLRS